MTYLTVPFFTYVFAIAPVWPAWLAVNLFALYLLLFKERFDPRTFVFWVAIVFVLPFLGFVLYLLWGSTIHMRMDGERKEECDERYMVGESDDVPEDCSRMVSTLCGAGSDIYTSGNDVKLHWTSREGVSPLAEALSGAERTIYIEAARFLGGEDGRRLNDLLCRKASEGVDVRIITSRLGLGRTPGLMALRKAGVRHRTFHSSINSAFSVRPANRNLRELCIIDGRHGFCGMGAYMELQGRASERLERRFLADWEHASGEVSEIRNPSVSGDGSCGVQLVSSGPDSSGMPMLFGYSETISGARRTLYMTFPYLVPGDEAYNAIKQAVIAGTDVRILIPVKCRHWYQAWNSLSAANPLIEAGARVYFARKAMVKTLVVADGKVCITGSGIYNSKSLAADYGENVIVYSQDVAGVAEAEFMAELEDAAECLPEQLARRSLMDQVKITIAKMFMFLNRGPPVFLNMFINKGPLADTHRCSNGRLQSHSERCQDWKVLQRRRHRSPRELSDRRKHRRGR